MRKSVASFEFYAKGFRLFRCRNSLLGPLFKLLFKTFSKEWVEDQFNTSEATSSTVNYIQQTLLIILEDISSSLISSIPVEVCLFNL